MSDLRVLAAIWPASRMAGDRLRGIDVPENPEK
jgi:hypothetical protein